MHAQANLPTHSDIAYQAKFNHLPRRQSMDMKKIALMLNDAYAALGATSDKINERAKAHQSTLMRPANTIQIDNNDLKAHILNIAIQKQRVRMQRSNMITSNIMKTR
jgi:hypothetical protein